MALLSHQLRQTVHGLACLAISQDNGYMPMSRLGWSGSRHSIAGGGSYRFPLTYTYAIAAAEDRPPTLREGRIVCGADSVPFCAPKRTATQRSDARMSVSSSSDSNCGREHVLWTVCFETRSNTLNGLPQKMHRYCFIRRFVTTRKRLRRS